MVKYVISAHYIFDAVKKHEAYRNRNTDKRYFIVWKISGEYFLLAD